MFNYSRISKSCQEGWPLIFFFWCFLFSGAAEAAENPTVIISEVAWMGTETSYNDEWIELYNETDYPIDLSGWTLTSADGSPNIVLSGTIRPKSFYLLERTDDETVPNIAADQIYKGALSNTGEDLNLFNSAGSLIDSLLCGDGWIAGDNSSKQTMERVETGWQTSLSRGGTPKNINSQMKEIPVILKEKEEAVKIPSKIVYPSNVIINELLPSPLGADSEEEWIEIFNGNNFNISLFEWKITDSTGKIASYSFPKETTLNPYEFLVLERKTSNITLNNSGDSLLLLHPDGNIVDSVSYEKAEQGKSYSRKKDSWIWNDVLTPGEQNAEVRQVEEKKAVEEKISEIRESDSIFLASAENQLPANQKNSSAVLTIAFSVAIVSGIIILSIKKILKISYNRKI